MDSGRPGIITCDKGEPDSVQVIYKQHHETIRARLLLHPRLEWSEPHGQKLSNDARDLSYKCAFYTSTDGGVFLFGYLDPDPPGDGGYLFRFFYGSERIDLPEIGARKTTWGKVKSQ